LEKGNMELYFWQCTSNLIQTSLNRFRRRTKGLPERGLQLEYSKRKVIVAKNAYQRTQDTILRHS